MKSCICGKHLLFERDCSKSINNIALKNKISLESFLWSWDSAKKPSKGRRVLLVEVQNVWNHHYLNDSVHCCTMGHCRTRSKEMLAAFCDNVCSKKSIFLNETCCIKTWTYCSVERNSELKWHKWELCADIKTKLLQCCLPLILLKR